MRKIDDSIIMQAKDMYVNQHISCEQIAKKLNIGASTVVKRLRKLGVEVVSHPHAGKFEVKDVIKLYVQDKIPIHKIAKMFNSTEKTISKVQESALREKINSSIYLKASSYTTVPNKTLIITPK